jgi:hypothetical protein
MDILLSKALVPATASGRVRVEEPAAVFIIRVAAFPLRS